MTYPQAIVAAAAIVGGAIVLDAEVPPAAAQVDITRGFDAGNAVAGDRLWWVEPGNKINRVYLCLDKGAGPACSFTDVTR